MSEYLSKAQALRAISSPHYNCAQSVLIPFASAAGLDEDKAFALAANFGGGMKMGSVCGTIVGSLMVLGLFGLDEPAIIQELYQSFKERHDNHLLCKNLLRACFEQGMEKKPHCDALVYEMVEETEKILREYGKI